MTFIEQNIREQYVAKHNELAAMLKAPSYNPVVFDRKLEELKRLQALLHSVEED